MNPSPLRSTALFALLVSVASTTAANAQTVRCWGSNTYTECTVPAGIGTIVGIDAGDYHTVALRSDGTVKCWGAGPTTGNDYGQCVPPTGLNNVVSVAAGAIHTIALRADGTVVCWGDSSFFGQSDVPPGLGVVTAISGGAFHTLALKRDGTVACWGRNNEGECTPPVGFNTVVAISAGNIHSMGLKADGTVGCWGSDWAGQSTVPVGLATVTAIAAGDAHSIARRTNGTVAVWGDNSVGQLDVPVDVINVAAIAAGERHCVALKSDGTVRCWGNNTFGQCTVPADLGTAASVAAAGLHSVGLRGTGIVAPTATLVSTTGATCGQVNGAIDVTVTGASTIAWTGPNGFFATTTDLSGIAAGVYTLTATGPGGRVTLPVTVTQAADTTLPVIVSYTASATAAAAVNCTAVVPNFVPSVVATDNCSASTALVITQSPLAGTSVGLGPRAISIFVTDESGNRATATATFTVTGTQVTYYRDADSDTFGNLAVTSAVCQSTPPAGYVTNSTDCDDTRLLYADADGDGRGAGAPVACGVPTNDDLCPTVAALLAPRTFYRDADNDTFGNLAVTTAVCAVTPPVGYAGNSTDCDDTRLLYADADGDGRGAGAPVACGVPSNDDNCPTVAALLNPVTYFRDADSDSFGALAVTTSVCAVAPPVGYVTNSTDCDDTRLLYADTDGDGHGAGNPVACGVASNDDLCPTVAALFNPVTYYRDADADTFGALAVTTSVCATSAPLGYVTNSTDCDDTRRLYADTDGDGHGAGAPVACGVPTNDDNCPTVAALLNPVTYFRDADADTFGALAVTTSVCATTAPLGYVANSTDCDDTRLLYADTDGDGHGAGNPVACGVASNDDACPTVAALLAPRTYYRDADSDTFGNLAVTSSVCAVAAPTGYVANSTDCDDTRLLYADTDGDGHGAGNPVACGVASNDDACPTVAALLAPRTYYRDADSDTFGNLAVTSSVCAVAAPAGYVANSTDCDDTRLLYADTDGDGHGAGNPVACGVASNDDACPTVAALLAPRTYYRDADSDTFGNLAVTSSVCAVAAPTGYVANSTDCDDTRLLYADTDGDGHGAGAPVACGVASNDDLCPTVAALFNPVTYYRDADSDSFGNLAVTTSVCAVSAPAGYVANSTDCDDTRLLYADTDGDGHGAGNPVACGVASNDDACPTVAALLAPRTYYRDADSDTFGNLAVTSSVCAVAAPTGYVANSTDCDDTRLLYADTDGDGHGAGNPVACGVASNDDACPTVAALFNPVTYYRDADSDSFGNLAVTTSVCATAAPTGYVANSTDCDDTRLLYADTDGDGHGAGNPVACGVASNDDACPTVAALLAPRTYYRDADSDTFGNLAVTSSVCAVAAPTGYVANSTDCDDTRLLYADTDGDGHGAGNPVACGVGSNDDACPTVAALLAPVTYYRDADNDGFGNAAVTSAVCATAAPTGYVTNSVDCDDTRLLYADTDGDGVGAGNPAPCGVPSNSDGCPADSGKTSPGTCGCGSPDLDSNGNGIADCADVFVTMASSATSLAADQTFTVRISSSPSLFAMTGVQFGVSYDFAHVQLVAVNPAPGSPFPLETFEVFNNAVGRLRYAVSVPSGAPATQAGGAIADLVFVVRNDAPLCGSAVIARFATVGTFDTRFTTSTGSTQVPLMSSLPSTNLDVLPPVLAGVPDSVSVAADAGSVFGAYVAAPTVTATDACDTAPINSLRITYPNGSVATAWPANGMFPIGTSQLVWDSVDAAGNVASANRTISVGNFQFMNLALSVPGATAGDSTRRIHLKGSGLSVLVDVTISGGVGIVRDLQVPVAASYGCITVKDQAHSLTNAGSVAIVGAKYSASFTLVQGDCDDNNAIDVVDFGIFATSRGAGVARNAIANFNGDTLVSDADFSFIAVNYLRVGDTCGAFDDQSGVARKRVSIKDLRRQGLGELQAADMNHDGWLDMQDIQMFLQGSSDAGRPDGRPDGNSGRW